MNCQLKLGICVQVEELKSVLEKITPKFIITDSQVFNQVKNIVPATMILTSFSILMANYKGELATLIKGAKTLDMLLHPTFDAEALNTA